MLCVFVHAVVCECAYHGVSMSVVVCICVCCGVRVCIPWCVSVCVCVVVYMWRSEESSGVSGFQVLKACTTLSGNSNFFNTPEEYLNVRKKQLYTL